MKMFTKIVLCFFVVIVALCSCETNHSKKSKTTEKVETNKNITKEVDNTIKENVINLDSTTYVNDNIVASDVVEEISTAPSILDTSEQCEEEVDSFFIKPEYIEKKENITPELDTESLYNVIMVKIPEYNCYNDLNSEKELVTDTIPERKFLGRIYNRGVVNHLYVKKNSWMAGLTVTHGQYSSEDVEFLSLIKDFNCDAKILAINPFVGYFIKDNVAVGLKFGYQNIYAGLNNLNIDIDDGLSLELKNMSFEEVLYKTTFFHRSYVGLDKGKRFGLFNETTLSYNFGNSRYIRGNENVKDTYTDIRELNISLNPGAAVFITENVCAELAFGVAGFKYRKEKQTTNGESSGWRKSSGANFKINLFNISIGIVAYL